PPLSGGPSYSQTLFIGFVPVTVGASAELAVGFTAGVTGKAPQVTACDPSNVLSASIAGTLTPFASVTGRAWGAIGGEFGGLGAEAGVEGNITLVDLRLPFSAGVRLQIEDYTDSDGTVSPSVPTMHLTNDAHFTMTLL